MVAKKLVERIEAEFDEFDRIEEAQRDKILKKGAHLGDAGKKELAHSFPRARNRFEQLTRLMDAEGHVSNQNYGAIIALSREIYVETMLALHRILAYDQPNPEVLKQSETEKDHLEATPPSSLYKKLKGHLIIGELYFLLDARMSTKRRQKRFCRIWESNNRRNRPF